MAGKNQQKRIDKRIAHARMVWAKKRIAAAAFWAALKDAEEQVLRHADSMKPEELAEIEDKLQEQRDYIKDYMMKARDVFVQAVGEENADFGIDPAFD